MEATTKAVSEYSATEAGLQSLKERMKGVVYDVVTTAGMESARKDRRELVSLRTGLDKLRLQLNADDQARIKFRNDKAKEITGEILNLETPIDEQIKAEEARKEAEKAEKARVAAEAQRVLEDKIIAISQLPTHCINKSSEEIEIFLSAVEAKELGGEFTGETRVRAEEAKAQAVAAIKEMHGVAVRLEEAQAKEEAERLERAAIQAEEDRVRALQIEEFNRQQAELAAQRAEFEKLQREAAERQAEIDRVAWVKEAEVAKAKDEAERLERERQQEVARVAAEEAKKKAAQAEKERKAAEKALKLQKAKCASAQDALKSILEVVNDTEREELVRLDMVRDICEANIA